MADIFRLMAKAVKGPKVTKKGKKWKYGKGDTWEMIGGKWYFTGK